MSDEKYPPEVLATGEWKYWRVEHVAPVARCNCCVFNSDDAGCINFRKQSFGCIGKGIIIRPENYDDYVVARVTHALGLDTET